MIYLFNQEETICIGFSDNPFLQIIDNKFVATSQYNLLMAEYNTNQDCMKVMQYFKKRLRLNEAEFTFPSQEYVDMYLKGDK